MAINMSEFINSIETGLKANKSYHRFFYRYKQNEKTFRGIINFIDKPWDKRTRISNAKAEVARLKSKTFNNDTNITENITVDKLAEIYFSQSAEKSKWNEELYGVYKIYISNVIGKKRVKDIKIVHLDNIKSNMEKQGSCSRTENGCSPRTIKKVLIESLKPILQYALDNKAIDELPKFPNIKQNRQKKIVENASIKLTILYTNIMNLYVNNPFYRALFLLALYGRRWNEIRTLQWNDINLSNHTYTIRAENNKINRNQTYELPSPIIDALLNINDERSGLIFKSPITNAELHSPKRQLVKLKQASDIPELTMHYFRHILVSAMGEAGTASTILSASLGHTNLDTVNQFYLSVNHTKASSEANKTIEKLTSKI